MSDNFRTRKGLDAASTAIKAATQAFGGRRNPRVADITQGEVVSLEFSAASTATARVGDRRTGALPLNQPFNTDSWRWSIEGGVLTSTVQGVQTGTMLFWVF